MNHGILEYVRGDAHTNTIESYFAILSRRRYLLGGLLVAAAIQRLDGLRVAMAGLPRMTPYRLALLLELARSWQRNLADNYDRDSQGLEEPATPSLKESRRRYGEDNGQFLYSILADAPSRRLLTKLMAFRILGHRRVKLPRNTPGYWRTIEDINRFSTTDELMPVVVGPHMSTALAMKDLRPMGYDMRLYAGDGGIACAFVQKQYEYHQGDVHCKAEAGDVVIDAGACWGDTTLYFAHEAGPTGLVAAFEFIPSNLKILHRNRDLNPQLSARIRLLENPIWKDAGRKVYYVDWGPGSRVTDDINKYHSWEGMVETTTIDETVDTLGRVDFIKMDIEGAELAALKGAEASIRKHRPKLAISLYHNPEDVETIPRYLAGLDLGYRFYLEHHTIYNNETVLFGLPR